MEKLTVLKSHLEDTLRWAKLKKHQSAILEIEKALLEINQVEKQYLQ